MQRLSATDSRIYPYPPEVIYSVLSNISGYAEWWPWGVKVKVLERTPQRIGDKIEVWASGGWFRCKVNALNPSERVGIEYYAGVVRGDSYWSIIDLKDGRTEVCYTIDLELHGLFPKLLGYIINFSWIHSLQFRRVLRCLEIYLKTIS